MLAHCRAWPDAPLTRLSMAQITTTQPVRSSNRAVRWAVFEPSVALVDGEPALTTTNGSSA